MNSKRSNEEIIKSLVRLKSHAGLAAMVHESGVALQECSAQAIPIHGHWMTMISISGDKIQLTFKAQFSTETARRWALRGGVHEGHLTDSVSKDFMREVCNVVAGFLKQALLEQNVSVGISLPVLCRGFDDLFFASSSRNLISTDEWKLVFADSTLYCSTAFEVSDDLKLNEELISSQHSSGDVEFL